jgi:hypothetical protein
MDLNIFAKKRTTKEGKIFYTYLTTLTKNNGEKVTMQVKFRDECGRPDAGKCPRVIRVKKKDCNYTEKDIDVEEYDERTGEITGEKNIIQRILWVSLWEDVGEYLDNSMDGFAGFNE